MAFVPKLLVIGGRLPIIPFLMIISLTLTAVLDGLAVALPFVSCQMYVSVANALSMPNQ
jgi:hypothetical protein